MERPSWEPTWSPGYTVIGYTDEKSIGENETVNALVVSSKISRSIYDHAKNLAKEHDIELGNFNSDLLRYYGVTANDQLRKTLFSLAAIIMSVIIIGSVALIYNAFGISVSERARHLGMLSSVGATKKQKRNSVFFEGSVIGAISLPIGILAGLAGIATTFTFINSFIEDALGVSEKLELVVTPVSILIACGISILTIFISTYLPAQKASKISAIDAIRQTEDIKLSRKTVQTSRLVRKVFGLEAEIGLKNVKRNKKRYLATLFSLVISIVLFLSVSFFTDNVKKSLEMTQSNLKYDIQISSSEVEKEVLAEFTKLEHVTKSTIIEESYLEAFIEIDQLPAPLKTAIKEDDSILSDGKYHYNVALHSLDPASFQEYVKQIGQNHEDFVQTGTPVAIVIEKIAYEDFASGKIVETKSIETEVGNTIDLFTRPDWNMEIETEQPNPEFLNTIQIGALTDQVPMGVRTALPGGINLIVSETTLAKLSIPEEKVDSYVYLNSTNPMLTQTAIEEKVTQNVDVYNVYQERKQQEQITLLMSVFIYGFIILISFISIANIFNTISTSISLRSREFAMLKSVGMTPKGFRKMINYESIFFGVNALAYGLPISVLVMMGIDRSAGYTFSYEFQIPWMSILFVIIMIFFIVGSAMLYSLSKLKNKNIIESLKQENI